MPTFDMLAALADRLAVALTQPQELLALASAAVAGLLVIVSAFVRTMIPLRWLAVGSNIGFIVYGLVHPSLLMVALHAVLLPVNLWRVRQMVQLTRRVTSSTADPKQMEIWLRPYMRSRNYRTGQRIFKRDAVADRLYFLASGRIELPEIGRQLDAGQMFGEIAFFTPDRRRSSSARCLTPCTVLSIDEATFRQLVYQNPDFGLHVVRLIAGRLSEDRQRLRVAEAAGSAVEPAAERGST
ncbi:MAG: cyclic nucleotide-binding domain-containing protein [Rubrivivax sp.]|nr:cyclic nucleotide-binding domain-containing protein [Rubrivivax sp.]